MLVVKGEVYSSGVVHLQYRAGQMGRCGLVANAAELEKMRVCTCCYNNDTRCPPGALRLACAKNVRANQCNCHTVDDADAWRVAFVDMEGGIVISSFEVSVRA